MFIYYYLLLPFYLLSSLFTFHLSPSALQSFTREPCPPSFIHSRPFRRRRSLFILFVPSSFGGERPDLFSHFHFHLLFHFAEVGSVLHPPTSTVDITITINPQLQYSTPSRTGLSPCRVTVHCNCSLPTSRLISPRSFPLTFFFIAVRLVRLFHSFFDFVRRTSLFLFFLLTLYSFLFYDIRLQTLPANQANQTQAQRPFSVIVHVYQTKFTSLRPFYRYLFLILHINCSWLSRILYILDDS